MADTWAATLARIGERPPVDPGGSVVIVSAHPDDEVIALGGWIAEQSGRDLLFVTATDGEASHPGSETLTPDVLCVRRPLELVEALRRLGVEDPRVQRLGLPDGRLAENRSALLDQLRSLVDGADLVLAPFEDDGHPDHDVIGDVCRELCTSTVLWRYPVWTWEWVVPDDQPWLSQLRCLPTGTAARRLKEHALAAFVTQVEPAGGQPDPVVTSLLLQHAVSAPEAVLA